ncbi:serine acetyltransferase [Vibrio sp. MA40-2]|uniref:serine acetyltransferase n=1 Tax=Vibrio sp. MA40-2 TaxID=3391828 RepID=UPI0039A44EA2
MMILSECWRYIKSDAYRYFGKCGFFDIISLCASNRFFRFCLYFRLSKSNNLFIRIPSSLFKAWLGSRVNIQISSKVPIGYGLFIPHGNVVVNSTATIGDNFTMCQFSSIGSVKGNAASIGSNVYVAPNVSIVEDVIISDNVVIGAGSVVVKNIETSSIVCGVPSRKVNTLAQDKVEYYIYNFFNVDGFNG